MIPNDSHLGNVEAIRVTIELRSAVDAQTQEAVAAAGGLVHVRRRKRAALLPSLEIRPCLFDSHDPLLRQSRYVSALSSLPHIQPCSFLFR